MEISFDLPDVLIERIADVLAAQVGPASVGAASPWMGVPAAAAYLGMTEDAVRKAAPKGLLPARQPFGSGTRYFFHRGELDGHIRVIAGVIRLESSAIVRLSMPPPDVLEGERRALGQVRVVARDGGLVDLQVSTTSLEIAGGSEARAKLAQSLENLADEDPFRGIVARHLDIAWFPDHGFLSQTKTWMIVTLLATPS